MAAGPRFLISRVLRCETAELNCGGASRLTRELLFNFAFIFFYKAEDHFYFIFLLFFFHRDTKHYIRSGLVFAFIQSILTAPA